MREYRDFPSKIFVSVRNNFSGEPFNVSLISGFEKNYGSKRGGNHNFPSKLFCLTLPNYFAE